MPERWELKVRSIRALEAPTERMWARVEQGPSGSERPPSRGRLAAAVVAFAVFAAGGLLAWEALRPGGSPGDSPSALPGNGRIAFELWRPTDVETEHLIYLWDPSEGTLTDITPDEAVYWSPAWSPDGREIAAVRLDGADHVGIYVMGADGSDLRELLAIGEDSEQSVQQVAWSPDGTGIGFIGVERVDRHAGNWIQRLYVMDGAEEDVRLLTDEDLQVMSFSWSPDGEQIVFAGQPRGYERADPHLYVVNASGGSPRLLADGTASDPAWSPDGTKIAYAGHAPGAVNSDIFLMNADGTGRTRLTTDPGADYWPVWSPDGTWIVFSRQGPGVADRLQPFGEPPFSSILVMDSDGTNERTLVHGEDLDGLLFHPAWQPVPSAAGAATSGPGP